MKQNQKEYDLALKEAEDPGNEASIKKRLGKIRANVESFKKIWKPGNEDGDMAEVFFALFFNTLGQLEEASYDGDEGLATLKRLEIRCVTCHDTYRDP